MKKQFSYAQLYLRLALGIDFLVPGLDRLGAWGPHGNPNVSWGDWQHFVDYARQTMAFMPHSWVPVFAVIATLGEGGFGLLLLIGLFTRVAALGSFLLSLGFAISMAISFGIESPLGYSVFTLSAASLLLASLPEYKWSTDSIIINKQSSL